MSQTPARPKIYHITHDKNLAGILANDCLWSDAEMLERGGPDTMIGISEIKQRRLTELSVSCHPETKVGRFVPFNFCPRSVMLYIIHRANHPALSYRGGQRPILHLEADLHEVVAWAEAEGRPWAFTDGNAGSNYFHSFRQVGELGQLNWEHIADDDFQDAEVKEAKQAEFRDCSMDTGHGNSAPRGPNRSAQGSALGLEVNSTSSPERAGHGHGDVSPFQGSRIDIRPDPRALPWADLWLPLRGDGP